MEANRELKQIAEMIASAKAEAEREQEVAEDVKLLKASIQTLSVSADELITLKHIPNRAELLLINNNIISMISGIKDILTAIEDLYYCNG